MMKHMKKFTAMLLAVIMVLGMAMSASAATVTNPTSRSYDAYQVLSGTQAENDATLGDVVWGSGVDEDALLAELKEDYDYFDDCNTAADVANVLNGKHDYCDEAKALAATATKHLTDVKTPIANDAADVSLDAGYWLLVDTSTPEEGSAKNAALLQVTNKGDITIAVKYDAPEVEKTVDDNDANIGDTVTFTLIGTMPSTLEGYETYKVIFHDTLSQGLTYTDTVKVTIDDADKTNAFEVNHENGQLTISCSDVLAQGAQESSKIVVTYTAVLNEEAVIGTEGNPNTVYLKYSNNPNWDGNGDEPTGNTPEDEVKVFTWEIPVVKIDGETKAQLADAVFTLYKDADCSSPVQLVGAGNNVYKVCNLPECAEEHIHLTQVTTDETGKFEIEGLEKGIYYLKEIKAPAGYNLLTDKVTVVIGEEGVLTSNGKTVTEVTVENNAGATLPETGGIGTTIFYIAGAALVLAAVVMLVTKRRMKAE